MTTLTKEIWPVKWKQRNKTFTVQSKTCNQCQGQENVSENHVTIDFGFAPNCYIMDLVETKRAHIFGTKCKTRITQLYCTFLAELVGVF